jgi:hypothetical protein
VDVSAVLSQAPHAPLVVVDEGSSVGVRNGWYSDTTAADPTGNPNFNAENLQASSGEFWGVMSLTLNPNAYAWDFESALKDPAQTTGPATYSDKGVGACHAPVDRW